jgi:hypothetical protein
MAVMVGIAALLVATSGCAQKDAGPEVASVNGKSKSAAKKDESKGDPAKFTKCMRDNGVKIQDAPAGEHGGVIALEAKPAGGEKAFEKAHEKCKKYAPLGESKRQLSEKDKAEMLAHARCMRKEGVDMPDPTFDESKPGAAMEIPGDMKKFEAALKKCGGGKVATFGRAGGGK